MVIYWLSVIMYLLVVAVNGLANALPINGQTTGDIANRISVLFTPAGYVFSIWGLIYILLAVWLVRQRKLGDIFQDTKWLFIISCVLNIGWILLWHYNVFLLTVPVMLGLLVTLIALYLRIKTSNFTLLDRLPFSVYLGWISVATIANISYVLVDQGWDGFGISPVTWTIVMLVVATVLGVLFRLRENDRAYVLVFIWAFIGIAVRQWDDERIISYASLILVVLMLGSLFVKNRR